MADQLIPVRIVGLMPAEAGVAVFIGNDSKTFSIHVDNGVGTSIALLLRGDKRERPLTHDLISLIFQAFSINVERIVINDLRNDTYYARITLRADNEIHHKMTEIDARPSDCLAIALETKKPIFVSPKVWDQVTDISSLLEKMKENLEENEEEN
ncbi:MAG: bifunctional nuclease family protein [Verrucomicrobiota bacterium]